MSEPQIALGSQSEQHEQILSVLKAIVNDLTGLGVDEVDVNASYLEAGVDSLLLIQLSQAIQNQFNVKLSLIQLLEELTTLEAVAQFLESQMPADKRFELQAQPETVAPAQAEPARPVEPAAQQAPAAPPAQNVIAPSELASRELASREPASRELASREPAYSETAYNVPTQSALARTAPAQPMEPRPAPRRPGEPSARPVRTSAVQRASGSGIERIIEQQLQLMSEQLNVLYNARATGPSLPSEAAAPPPSAAQSRQTEDQAKQASRADFKPVAATDAPADGAAAEQAVAPKVKPGPARIVPELFTPYKPFQTSAAKGLTPQQQAYLEGFIARYTARTRESKRYTEKYRPYLADSRNSVGFRLVMKELLYQIVGERSQGSRIWDIDGNEYIDITMGFGVHLFGHSPDFLVEAMQDQSRAGLQLGPQSYLAGRAAELVCELTGLDRAMFCNSGTEAVMAAMRAARTITHRNKIAIFAGGYHGWSDGTLAKPMMVKGELRAVPMVPGVPQSAVDDLIVLDYDSPESLEILRKQAHTLAAIMVEPVQSRRPDIQPKAFLHELRKIADESGAVLIFDEMVTGFRVHPGGAQAVFGVQADLATYGKVIGGGLPIGAIAGKAAYMDALDGGMWQFGDGSYPTVERTLFAGAFFKHPLTMAATVASLEHIQSNMPALHHQLNDRSSRMARAVNEYFESAQVPIRLVNFGSLFRFLFPGELKFTELFFYHMNEQGAFMWEGGTCFLSTAHTDADVDFVIGAVKRTVEQMQEGGFLPGAPPDGSGGSPRSLGSKSVRETSLVTVSAEPAATEAASRLSASSLKASVDLKAGRAASATINFSVYYFGKYESQFRGDKYDLLWEGAKYADRNGFEAVWIPERHFHEFGGFSPNPSVLAAALARETTRIKIRAGSVVLPLHNPIRVAEEWSIVDNISKGRVGISFASGYRPDDFVFYPDAYEKRRELTVEGIKLVHKLWRGEPVQVRAGGGSSPNITLYPMPMQRALPTWLTSNHEETCVKAGELGIGILTNLHDQTIEEMALKIAAYREALARSGHDASKGHVTVLLHTFLCDDAERARQIAREPFYEYLKTSFSLLRNVAESQGKKVDFNKLSEAELQYLLAAAYDRYVRSGALIGTPESCREIVEKLIAIGVDEIGCLIDFGVSAPLALEGLHYLNLLRQHYAEGEVAPAQDKEREAIAAREVIAAQAAPVAASASSEQSGDEPQGVIRFPLTEGQKQLWTLAQMGPVASRAFNESLKLDMRGPLDLEAMRRAIQSVVDRHEALRTTFSPTGDYQQIYPKVNLYVPLSDFSQLDEALRQSEVERWIASQAQQPFDFAHGPMLRAHIAKLGEEHHLLALTIHHIVVDGWSLSILLNEIREFYTAERQGVTTEMPEPMSYRQYAEWQACQQQSAQTEADEAYWMSKYADSFPVLNLPTDRPRPSMRTFEGDRVRMKLDPALFEGLKGLCVRRRCTMFMMLLAAFEAMLHHLTGEDDIVIGTPLAGQSTVDGKDLVGFCINEVALRSRLTGDPAFAEFLAGVKSEVIRAYDHQNYPFSMLVKRLNLARTPGQPPLISAVFILDKSGPKLKFHDLEVEPDSNPTRGARVDFHWNVIEQEDHLLLESAFSTDLFDAETILRWMKHYENLLRAIVANPQQRLSELSLLTDEERNQLLYHWNSTRADYPSHYSVVKLFEAQAAAHPLATAVEFADQRISYSQLNRRANQLARYLMEQQAGAEQVVAIYMSRCAELIEAMLAVLKTGAAYLPLDPTYPAERVKYMIEDAGVRVVLSDREQADRLSWYEGIVIDVQQQREEIDRRSGEDLGLEEEAESLAYVIYTSGSTGNPKGVMVRRGSLLNHALALIKRQELDPDDRHMQFVSTSLDASMEEIYPTLLSGATLIMHRSPSEINAEELVAFYEEREVTIAHMPPAYWHQLVEVLKPSDKPLLPKLRLLLSGGESSNLNKLKELARLTRHPIRFINAYGPTEGTITSTTFDLLASPDDISRIDRLPIGKPISNAQVYILDKRLQPAPVGVTGELYIGGAGVARGYLKRPDLTAERFIPNPFSDQPGARMYRTGDLARYLTGGDVEFIGRADNQAKVRGYRIELGEVEAALSRHAGVRDCAVIVRDDLPEYKRLVAYVVAGGDQPPSINELRSFLKESLPDHMVPSWFVMLESLPLTPGGKLDRKQLPKPDDARPELDAAYVAPSNELERIIAKVWQEVLSVEKVGVNDNFFDLGGHSLLVVQACARLREEMNREIEVIEVFQYPTISSLAAHLAAGQAESLSPAADRPQAEQQSAPAAEQRPTVAMDEGIAIIAMAGRFPGAGSVDEFWQNLQAGVEGICFFSDEELIAAGVDPALLKHPKYVKASGVLNGIDLFDAGFFGYSPREAEVIDPQHRLFLESAWQALELAGYDSQSYAGSIGVYAGVSMNTYLLSNLLFNSEAIAAAGSFQTHVGSDKDFLPTRVSYKLNLRGPSINVQTACSTSLVAVHLACRALQSGECNMALAGGVSVSVPQQEGYIFQEGGILSPDGHCRAFDAEAQGTIGGSGVGVVVLKRLSDALADGDRVYAIIKGSAINNDGSFKIGYTAPSINGQAEVIAMAQAAAGVAPDSISYIEAHGTGTPLGDPIEVAALNQVFKAKTDKKQFCAIGSVKTNVGHLDAAAGVTGLIKTALALHHKKLPPSLHYTRPNPKIDFDNSPFFVNTTLRDWQWQAGPRRAGVSSFGIGGTNAHVILEEAPQVEASGEARAQQLLVLSARTNKALDRATENLAAYLKQNPTANLADVAYTLQLGRRAFNHRRMVVCRDADEAVRALEGTDASRLKSFECDGEARRVVFMFSGQGAQYAQMAAELYQSEPVFKEHLDICLEGLKAHLGFDLKAIIFPADSDREQAGERLKQTAVTQPALFAIEYALARLWMEWGVHPESMIGHSVGEYVAACLAGVMTLEEALELVAARGRLMQEMDEGAMLAVALSEEEIQWLLGDELSLAAVNGPRLCVVSGPIAAIAEFQSKIGDGVWMRRLETSHAFHSAMMEPMLERFTEAVRKVKLKEPAIPYISNLSGTWIKPKQATDPRYWADHLRETVRFADGINELMREPARVLLEVGPGRTLTTMVKRIAGRASSTLIVHSLPGPDQAESDLAMILNALGRLWLSGAKVNWKGLYAGQKRRRVSLPTYPFERERFWIDKPAHAPATLHKQVAPVAKSDLADWFYVPSWRQSPLVRQFDRESLAGRSVAWVILLDEGGVGAKIAERLELEHQEVITVSAAERFAKLGDKSYAVNPRSGGDIQSLVDDLRQQGARLDRIVHLWGLTAQSGGGAAEDFDEGQARGFYSLLSLADALAKGDDSRTVLIDVATSATQVVLGEEEIDPAKATVLAATRVIPKEYPNIRCRVIDVEAAQPGTRRHESIVEQLLSEITSGDAEGVVAFRGRRRWVQDYEPVRIDSAGGEASLRRGGVYLITGWTSQTGLALAHSLAAEAKARLVLVDSINVFEEAERGGDVEISRKIGHLDLLRSLAEEVMLVKADPANQEEMRDAVRAAKQHFGAINGVIHSAGDEEPAGMGSLSGTLNGAFSAKVKGAQALVSALKDERLDFLVLCSSRDSLLGARGRLHSCAGDAYLDALAQKDHATNGKLTVAINWDSLRELPAQVLAHQEASTSYGEILKRVLRSKLPQVIVSAQDFREIARRAASARDALLEGAESMEGAAARPLEQRGAHPQRAAHPRPDLSTPFEAPRAGTEARIAAIWAELLGVEQVGRSDNFFELGGDSIIGLQIVLRANEAGLEFSPQDIFQHQTVAQLAALVDKPARSDGEPQHAAAIDAPHTDEATASATPVTASASPDPADFHRVKIDKSGLDDILKKIKKTKR